VNGVQLKSRNKQDFYSAIALPPQIKWHSRKRA